MAKNKIQFQKGLILTHFLAQYGTEEQCREALFRFCWPQGFRCPECGCAGYREIRESSWPKGDVPALVIESWFSPLETICTNPL